LAAVLGSRRRLERGEGDEGCRLDRARYAGEPFCRCGIKRVYGTRGGAGPDHRVAGDPGRKASITGLTSAPTNTVRIVGTKFTTTSDSLRRFRFLVDYRTPDCKLTLQTVLGSATYLIGNCGPHGLQPRGVWKATQGYLANDTVLLDGTTWRALRANKNKRPGLSANASYGRSWRPAD
jgi:hypothetical protein